MTPQPPSRTLRAWSLVCAWFGALLSIEALAGCGDDSDGAPAQGEVPDRDAFGVFARGLHLDRVTLDQGVSIAARGDGEDVPVNEWPTQLVQDRNVLTRAMWTLEEDFEPRILQARFSFRLPSGETQAALHELFVAEDANEAWYDLTFRVAAPGSFLVPGVEFDVGIYELGQANGSDEQASVLVDEVPRYPREPETSTPLPISAGSHRIEIIVVPIDHQFDGPKECAGLPPIDAEELARMADAVRAVNPANEVIVKVRPEPMVWAQSAADLGKILDALVDLRVADNAAPWVYYFGAIDPCDWGSSEGYAGLGYVPQEPTQELAWKRVSVGDYSGPSRAGPRSTFVHELGHNSGRKHVPCAGNEANTVTDYPTEGGLTGRWGFDLVNFSLHPPSDADFMSYCDPTWVSAYGWNQVLPVIATLSAWQMSAMQGSGLGTAAAMPGEGGVFATSGPPSHLQLILATYADGSQRLLQVPLYEQSRQGSLQAASTPSDMVVLLHQGVEVARVLSRLETHVGLDVASGRAPQHRVAVVPLSMMRADRVDEVRWVDRNLQVHGVARVDEQRLVLDKPMPSQSRD